MSESQETISEADAKVKLAGEALRQGKLDEASKLCQTALELAPNHLDSLYMLAVSRRYQGKHDLALETLNTLILNYPDYGRAYQEMGHNYKKQEDPQKAMDAFEHAVRSNPTLQASWREVRDLYKNTHNETGIRHADAELKRLSSLPKQLILVSSLLHEHKLFQAEQLCRAYLQDHPKDVEAMRLLAMLAVRLSVYDDAEFLLESCVEFDPDNWRARADYVNILHKRQKFSEAMAQAEVLKKAYPGNVSFEMSYANQAVGLGDFETALNIYDKVIAAHPNLDMPNLVRGHALKTIGRLEEGIESYRAAYKARPAFGDAYWSLANLKTYRFEDVEIKQMKAGFEAPRTVLQDRFHLAFALGKAFEDREDYNKAFQYYEQGNALKQTEVRYDPELLSQAMTRQMDLFTSEFLNSKKGLGSKSQDPIFIVGLPRAGSTLLEQILASHSKVDGTMELPNIMSLAQRMNGRRLLMDEPQYPNIISDLKSDSFTKLGDKFISDTKIHRQNAQFFIDKMPNNFLHIGLIHMILPNAKIIDARRNPMACCFSGFKQLFADGQEFSYSLENIGAYYRDYVELMAHWDKVLPGRILRVQYEDVVTDFEQQVRRILDYCDLPFEENCLEFYKTERSVRTPSSEQVRQPIYKSGMEQWRLFESHLQPLRNALGDVLVNYR